MKVAPPASANSPKIKMIQTSQKGTAHARSLGRGHAGVPINQECERAERREVDQPTIDNLILSDGRGRSVAGIWKGTPISAALSPTLSKTTLFVGSLAKSGTGGRKEVRCAP